MPMFKFSIGSLILFNLVPLIGVLFFGWSLSAIMVLYWFENVIIGFYNVIKMIAAEGKTPITRLRSGNKPVTARQKPSLVIFFIVHFGMFTLGHGVFVLVLFGKELENVWGLLPAALCLFVSHGISFFHNFIRNQEYKRVAFQDLFFQPYKRIIIMHITIIVGASASLILNLPSITLVVLIFLKILADVFAHTMEHKKFESRPEV
ncbi:DUF6498-containing protein [Acidobacteriota bacterium]